jgi:hypothetical protein
MKKKMITYEFDPANPPALTPMQKAELKKLAAMPDSSIDFSDIPQIDENKRFMRLSDIGFTEDMALAQQVMQKRKDLLRHLAK